MICTSFSPCGGGSVGVTESDGAVVSVPVAGALDEATSVGGIVAERLGAAPRQDEKAKAPTVLAPGLFLVRAK
jgi:hypothetical protein